MSQNTPAMNTQKFNEVEERIFALLDNAEQTQQQSTDLLTKLSSILERLEKSETECNQQVEVLKQQAITAEKKRQDEWDAWKKQQAQLWQTEQKSQFENWQQAQSSQWQTWQDKQQQKLTNSIATFNQSADNLINKLDEKIKGVNLTQSTVENLIQKGSSQVVEKMIGEQVKLTVGKKLEGIVDNLNRVDLYIQNSESSAERLRKTVIDLENSTFIALGYKIEAQVKQGVENGLTAGLAEASQKIGKVLENAEKQSLESQANIFNEFKQGVKQAGNEITQATTSLVNQIATSQAQVKDSSAACVKSFKQVKQIADESVEDVKTYHDDLVNSGYKKWVFGWTAFITAFVTLAGVITYQVNKPDYEERNAVATEVQMLLQQKSAIENSYSMQKTKSQDGKFYVSVDKSDCIDGDYCKQREPTSYTTPTQQQLTPPKPSYPSNTQLNSQQPSQSNYQPSTSNANGGSFGNGNNPYAKNGNPFGTSGSNSQNPYKN